MTNNVTLNFNKVMEEDKEFALAVEKLAKDILKILKHNNNGKKVREAVFTEYINNDPELWRTCMRYAFHRNWIVEHTGFLNIIL